ncbi:MAG: hypothetical protein ACRBF0_17140 [Calditrichia bacterium]
MPSSFRTPEELTYDQLRCFLVAAWTYMRRENPMFADIPAEADPVMELARMEKTVSESRLRQAVKQAVQDLIAVFKQMPAEHISRLEQHLDKEEAPSLARMLSNTRSRIDQLIERAEIRSVREYYLLQDYLSSDEANDLPDSDRQHVENLLTAYKNRPLD